MSIECYHSGCMYHSCHDGDEGPFCDEFECKATEYELEQFENARKEYLTKYTISKGKPS